MRIEYRRGDLLASGIRVVCHGCNAQARMGAGIAKAVRERHPAAYDAYMAAARDGEGLRLGRAVWADCGPGRVVVNAITQLRYGNAAQTGAVYVDYDAVAAVVADIDGAAATGERLAYPGGVPVGAFDEVGFPLIGAGLAGGSWGRIAGIIEAGSAHFRPVVYTLDGVVPRT